MNLPPAPVDVDTYMLQTMNLREAEPLHQSMQGLFFIIVIINRVLCTSTQSSPVCQGSLVLSCSRMYPLAPYR
jgi:hypothetical protein